MSVIRSALAGVVLAASVSAQAHGQAAKPASSPAGAAAAVSEAKRALDDKLLDCRTTRFRTVRFVRVRSRWNAFCGEINTTNRMGGFTGWRAFLLPVGEEAANSVYDKPTIAGEPTTMGSFMQQYGSHPIEGDPATRMIVGTCGEDAVRIDQTDYAVALTYRP